MKLETSIYDKLPATTKSGNVVIHKVYQRKGVEYARSIGGAFTLRVRDMDKHFGNPYSHVRALCEKDNLVLTATTKDAVIMFIHYVLRSMDSRAVWIRSVLDSKFLKFHTSVGNKTELSSLTYGNGLASVNFIKVDGHSDNVGNNRADELAVQAKK